MLLFPKKLFSERSYVVHGTSVLCAHRFEVCKLRHAACVGSWIKALRDDPLEIFRAAADAEKMCEFVLGLEQKQVQELFPEQAPLPAEAAHPEAFVDLDGSIRD